MYKVGLAGDPMKRLSALQTGSPYKLNLISITHLLEDGAARRFESRCHDLLAAHRASGEWFQAPLCLVLKTIKGVWLCNANMAIVGVSVFIE